MGHRIRAANSGLEMLVPLMPTLTCDGGDLDDSTVRPVTACAALENEMGSSMKWRWVMLLSILVASLSWLQWRE